MNGGIGSRSPNVRGSEEELMEGDLVHDSAIEHDTAPECPDHRERLDQDHIRIQI